MLLLGDHPGEHHAPKLANLSRLSAAGLPVPPGLGLDPDELALPAPRAHLLHLLRQGPLIVRAALTLEDTADAAAPGLGLSIPNCSDLPAIDAAAARIAAAAHDPALLSYTRGLTPTYQLLIQRQISRRWLVVAAREYGSVCVELHGPAAHDALAAGLTPAFSGPLELCEPDLRLPLAHLFDQVASAMPQATALDLELILDPQGQLWLVQARPLTRPLTPGWPAFLAELAPGRTQLPDLPGLWRLDAEHNPAPLSPAHAGLIAWLAERGAPSRVLAGWLYDPVPSDTTDTCPPEHDPFLALRRLRAHTDAARLALLDLSAALPLASPTDLASLLQRSLEHLRHVLDHHASLPTPPLTDLALHHGAPLCLRERHAHLDVLPLAWDIASPVLADMLPGTQPSIPVQEDTLDRGAASLLLRELDDHLFALGLAPLRRIYLRAGQLLALGDAVFLLTPPELHLALLSRQLPDLPSRRQELARRALLTPPLALFDGRPLPSPPRRLLRGLPTGPTHRGPIAQRRDLADLLERPPDPKAIVILPALTAQAALALRELALQAVCCEHGGALSHAALMARELGLSALIGCLGCTHLPDGALAELDTRLARLHLL